MSDGVRDRRRVGRRRRGKPVQERGPLADVPLEVARFPAERLSELWQDTPREMLESVVRLDSCREDGRALRSDVTGAVPERWPKEMRRRDPTVRVEDHDGARRRAERDRLAQDVLDRGTGTIRHERGVARQPAHDFRHWRRRGRRDVDRDATLAEEPEQGGQLGIETAPADEVDDRGHPTRVAAGPRSLSVAAES